MPGTPPIRTAGFFAISGRIFGYNNQPVFRKFRETSPGRGGGFPEKAGKGQIGSQLPCPVGDMRDLQSAHR